MWCGDADGGGRREGSSCYSNVNAEVISNYSYLGWDFGRVVFKYESLQV